MYSAGNSTASSTMRAASQHFRADAVARAAMQCGSYAYFVFRYGISPPALDKLYGARVERGGWKDAPVVKVEDAAGGEVDFQIVAGGELRHRLPGATTTGSPRLMELRKKMRAKETAMTAPAPANLMAAVACSRLEPQPKFFPATRRSPGRSRPRNSG